MTAKEMFEKLGYELAYEYQEGDDEIRYYGPGSDDENIEIIFYLNERKFSIESFIEARVDADVLKAINKQIEELGWYK